MVHADASPDKRFFISMLVKDIQLLPAIVDLVDNSVDAARKLRGSDTYEGLRIDVSVSSSRFEIWDNCGGMEAETARRHAFRFGRPSSFEPIPSAVGQFGVGMKRAIFKMGSEFIVQSATINSSFLMHVDVDEWAGEDGSDWSFEFEEYDDDSGVSDITDTFTHLIVERLNSYVSDDFERTEVVNTLRSQIAIRHQSAVQRGMEISVNGVSISSNVLQLLSSESVQPINKSLVINVENGEINTQIVAGLSAEAITDSRDEAKAETFTEVGEAGWYVYCNDRLVLAADRSPATGWGSAGAAYHPQYRHFRGYVRMNAEDSSLMPWNTTKTSLDSDTSAFRQLQVELFAVLREVQTVINRVKREASYDRDEGQAPTPLVRAIGAAKAVAIDDLPTSVKIVVPAKTARNPVPESQTTVQYKVADSKLDRVREVTDEQSASKIGRITFDYFVESEVDD